MHIQSLSCPHSTPRRSVQQWRKKDKQDEEKKRPPQGRRNPPLFNWNRIVFILEVSLLCFSFEKSMYESVRSQLHGAVGSEDVPSPLEAEVSSSSNLLLFFRFSIASRL
mmetsp:Transcript_849/g.1837  ORF Transcript_849/g.1837 Transcript_849/m.1837 type:complete len:109 (-) Transcript_849:683-1009(-)